ncbi:MAG: hypothetical protein QM498_16595, partial [Desulfobacterium sp.]
MGKLFKTGSLIIELQILMIPGTCDEWQWCDLWLTKIVKEKEGETWAQYGNEVYIVIIFIIYFI